MDEVVNKCGPLLSKDDPLAPQRLQADQDIGLKAVTHLLTSLRQKVSLTTWTVLCSAYRELTTDLESAEGKKTSQWLQQSLFLNSVESNLEDVNADTWLMDKASTGQVRKKEGVDGKWIVCKIR